MPSGSDPDVRTLLLDHADVAAHLPMRACIAAMKEAFLALERGDVTLPLRSVSALPREAGWLGVMPVSLADPPLAAVKAITVVPANSATALDSHQGAVLLFDAMNGRLLAILDASAITAIRTAAVSGLATDHLARPGAGDLAILGTGIQAATHLEAVAAVRPLRRVRVWGRNPAHAAAFVARERARLASLASASSRIETAPSARDAVEGADLVVTATAATEPVLRGEWLAPGAHVNAVGACRKNFREVDGEVVRRARVVVDRRESAMAEAGDILLAIAESAVGPDPIAAELGQVLAGSAIGRRDDAEITLFKSVGLAIQDLCAARAAYLRALAAGAGVSFELGGRRDA